MSAPIKSRKEIIAYLRQQFAEGNDDPKLTISEMAVLVQYHRRTLQRWVDEGSLPVEKATIGNRVHVRWKVVKKTFKEDTAAI